MKKFTFLERKSLFIQARYFPRLRLAISRFAKRTFSYLKSNILPIPFSKNYMGKLIYPSFI